MIYFIGAGPGAVDLITVRGAELLRRADMIIYAGSLVNHELVHKYARQDCEICNSAGMTLEQITEKLIHGHERNLLTVRLHSGDPALYGAIREQIEVLREKNITFEIVPGVSSLFAASASLKTEYSHTLTITRIEGRTPVGTGKSTVLFLSAGMIDKACNELIASGYAPDTPAALVYKASWPDEKIIRGTLATLPGLSQGINKTALILAGDFLDDNSVTKSKLYDKNFSHGFRNHNCGIHTERN